MREELTPLEALDRFRCFKVLNRDYELEIIETALKEYEELQKDYCEVVEKRGEWQEKNNKKLKALEVVKDRFAIQFIESDLPDYYGIMQIGINPIYIKTKEEFDLLKEVLL